MAITEVASQRAASGNNNAIAGAGTLAFPNNVTVGNLLICAGSVWGSAAAPASVAVTDTRSTVYTVVLGAIPSGLTWRTFIAYGVALSSGACTISVDPAGTSSFSFSLDEFNGQHGTPADVAGGDTAGNAPNASTFTASDSITTVAANALLIGVMSHDVADRVLTAATNYTLIGKNETNSNNQCHAAVFRIVTTPTAYTVGVDASSAGGGANPGQSMQTHSFKPGVASPLFHRSQRFFRRMSGLLVPATGIIFGKV